MNKKSRKTGAKKRKKTPQVSGESSVHAPSSSELILENSLLPAWARDEKDENLSLAKKLWLQGEWKTLANMSFSADGIQSENDFLVLLAGSACQQIGDYAAAEKLVDRALELNCSRDIAVRILTGGTHNILGRMSAIQGDTETAYSHFSHALELVTGDKNISNLVKRVHAIAELRNLGLLPQAASLIDDELLEAGFSMEDPKQQARLDIMKSEIELLNHELSLALERSQLYTAPDGVAPIEATHDNYSVRFAIDDLQRLSVSQLGQDLWVLEHSGYKRNGYFVEFGAANGILLSNTWLLEKEFDWQGICAEPNPEFLRQLQQNRNCIVSNACVGAVTGEKVEFLMADEFSSMTKYASSDGHAGLRENYLAQDDRRILLETISLDDLLEKYKAPGDIDYISIDTEGSELEILETFPFDKWNVRLFTIEHNYTENRSLIRSILSSHGYTCLEKDYDDWYFMP